MNERELVRSGVTREQVAALEARLLEEKATLTRRLASRRQALAAAPAREIDESDWASDSADQSLAVRLVDRDTKLLQEVKAALARVEAGTYGVCELTGEPIGFERLQVRPWTRYAVAAKEEVERRREAAAETGGVALERGEADDAA
jgi:DnaK suppressor protein